MSAEAPYQNGVTVRAHSRPEPLVGLEINLNFGVIHKGGAIPWRKTKQQKTPVSRHKKKRALAHADPSTHILHPLLRPVETSGQSAKKRCRTPVTPFFIQCDNQGGKKSCCSYESPWLHASFDLADL